MIEAQIRKLKYVSPHTLTPDPRNPRKHGRAQIRAIANSLEAFGFNAPILVDKESRVVSGHGRLEAAKLLDLEVVPVISLDNLSETQAKAYMLADNKLTDRSSWDEGLLAIHLKELSELTIDFEIEATGFEPAEIDYHIQSLDGPEEADNADEFDTPDGSPVSRLGDLWHLGDHEMQSAFAFR